MAWPAQGPNVVVIPGAKKTCGSRGGRGLRRLEAHGKEIDRIEEAYHAYREAGGV